ncbi:MAG: hypothetical protein ACPLKX_05675 [Dictyoglomaceae bacterium]
MREKVWGGLILFATSLSLILNVYTLLKNDEKSISIDHEILAKPVSYTQNKTQKEDKENLRKFTLDQFKEIRNIKLGRIDPFAPLIKEEEILEEIPTEETSFSKKIVEVKKIERIPYVLRGILGGKEKILAIFESENGEKSFVVEEGQRIENYKIERIDVSQKMVIIKDLKGNFLYIKM